MPEYLAPGVYVEETSFRPKTIEGVGTSTAAFVGATRFGPTEGEPELLTSFLDFERIYGGLDQLSFDGEIEHNHLAHAVRAFFENGGRRLYVARAYELDDEPADDAGPNGQGRAAATDPPQRSGQALAITARHPGAAGNTTVRFDLHVGPNALHDTGDGSELRGVGQHEVVYALSEADDPVAEAEVAYWVDRNDEGDTILRTSEGDGGVVELDALDGVTLHPITISVTVGASGRFDTNQTWEDLQLHPDHRSSLTRVFASEPLGRLTELYTPIAMDADGIDADNRLDIIAGHHPDHSPRALIRILRDQELGLSEDQEPVSLPRVHLTGGSDGVRPTADTIRGRQLEPGRSSGLRTLEDIEDIAIVAAPGATAVGDADTAGQAMQALVSHAQRMRYRIAVLDTPAGQTVGEVRDYRGAFDSSHAALYYPWVEIDDPITRRPITTPPSGFIAGIYARNDVERGVHKAPANEIVRLARRFEFPLNTAQQEVLNPLGINCLRYFEGRGHRVWGARTVTSDPEWKYVNLRRYFAYVERSVDLATQWAVFEPNGSLLWGNIRRSVEDFLFNELANRRLLGETPDEAYFVRCDRSTMTQNDLDNGRLVCLIGIAPLRPAEFVIFRIGQKTLDANA